MINFPEIFTAALLLIDEEFIFTEILRCTPPALGHRPPDVFLTQQQANKVARKREYENIRKYKNMMKQGYEWALLRICSKFC